MSLLQRITRVGLWREEIDRAMSDSLFILSSHWIDRQVTPSLGLLMKIRMKLFCFLFFKKTTKHCKLYIVNCTFYIIYSIPLHSLSATNSHQPTSLLTPELSTFSFLLTFHLHHNNPPPLLVTVCGRFILFLLSEISFQLFLLTLTLTLFILREKYLSFQLDMDQTKLDTLI